MDSKNRDVSELHEAVLPHKLTGPGSRTAYAALWKVICTRYSSLAAKTIPVRIAVDLVVFSLATA